MNATQDKPLIAPPNFSESDIATLKTYFELNKKYQEVLNAELLVELAEHQLWGPMMKMQTPEQRKIQGEHSMEMQRAAIYDGKWDEYSNELMQQGRVYARMNINYSDWYEIISLYKVRIIPHIKRDFADSVELAVDFLSGLSKFTDYAMYGIAEAYFQEKNSIIAENEERFRAIFQNSADHIVLIAPDGKISMINHTASGTNKEELIGQNIYDLESVSSSRTFRPAIESVFTQKVPAYFETKSSVGGKEIFYSCTASPILNDDGTPRAAIVISRDITDRKKSEIEIRDLNASLERKVQERTAELQEINKELESFSYSVSHDLRGPLRAINGFTMILQEELPKDVNDEIKDAMNEIVINARKMGKLIDELLEFSRLGKQQVSKTFFDMKDMFDTAISELKKSEKNNAVRFQVKELADTHGDRNMIKQVVVNLLSNAVKYSGKKPDPEVEIGSYPENGHTTYYVKDNGAGFDMAYYNKLFGVFQRLHRMDEFEGTGVGLAIVQRIITKHAGKVWAEGKVDEGATFYFSLPANR
ncbi:MAG TPA: ATP-binding protein [Bacteroidia bacterium]|nr:ATP-binding protein [Bacteroidia bacterium]